MPLPAAVRELAAARQVRLAWENADALTFEVDDGPLFRKHFVGLRL